jgi:quinol monooxygenase YgiN
MDSRQDQAGRGHRSGCPSGKDGKYKEAQAFPRVSTSSICSSHLHNQPFLPTHHSISSSNKHLSTMAFTPKDLTFILTVQVTVPADKHAEFFSHFKPCADKVIAEPECKFFFVQKGKPESPYYNPDVITWIEGWTQGPEWLESVQLKKPYYEAYKAGTEKLFSAPVQFQFWSPEEGLCLVKA